MSELKTQPNQGSVKDFMDQIEPVSKKEDCKVLLHLLGKITKEEPVMWGDSIVGFGRYHYKYKTGREGDWYVTGFSPRKANLTIYCPGGFAKSEPLLKQLGKHKTSAGCIYIKKLKDIDLSTLEEVVINSIDQLNEWFPEG